MSALAQSTFDKYFGSNEYSSESNDFCVNYLDFESYDEFQNLPALGLNSTEQLLTSAAYNFFCTKTNDVLASANNLIVAQQKILKGLVTPEFENLRMWNRGVTLDDSFGHLHWAKKANRSTHISRNLPALVVEEAQSLGEKFTENAEKWKSATIYNSSMVDIVSHPAYQRIIGLGPDVIPFILCDLEVNGGHWFSALVALTGENPVMEDDVGRYRKMKEAWLDWGRSKGLI